MNFTRPRPILCAVFLVLALPAIVLACGPYFSSLIFVAPRPAADAELLRGKVGLVRPTFSRRQIFLAYRNLGGAPLNDSEQTSLNDASGEPRISLDNSEMVAGEWLKARNEASTWLGTTRQLKNYSFFLNCTPDAFQTAAAHWQELIEGEGVTSPSVRAWGAAQDLVFKNCSQDAGIPDAPTPEMTQAQRADRMYQIAAANFYATRYDVAAEQFQAIARETASPWHDLGLFLAARCYLRKATVGPLLGKPGSAPAGYAPPPMDQDSMRKALALLQQVAGDESLERVHDSALRLISFAELHLEPEKQALKLSSALREPSQDAQFATHLDDYLHLQRTKVEAGDELGDWIAAVQGPGQSSIDRWKTQPASQLWLVAALLAANSKSAAAPQLIAAALKVAPNSPAFASAQVYAARLLYERGQYVQLRHHLDILLGTRRAELDTSAVAALTILRSRTANSLDDFAQYATLPPTGFADEADVPGWWEACPSATGRGERACTNAMITPTAAAMMNHMPISALVRLAGLTAAPLPLRSGAAQIAFARGVLLGDFLQADAAARLLSAQSEEDAADLKGYLAARHDEERRFAAAFVVLHWPGLEPVLSVSFLRDGSLRKLSEFRNNWWSTSLLPKVQSSDPLEELPSDETAPRFLNRAERTAGEREYAALGKVESASNWLPRAVIEWAESHRDDPRVPEALHLAVNATHYAGDTTGAGPYSKKAFQLLHRNYPRSPWTAKTKYYY